MDIMFEVPGSDVKSVHITEACVKGLSPPEYVHHKADSEKTNDTVPKSDMKNGHCTEASAKARSDELEKLADSVKAFINYF